MNLEEFVIGENFKGISQFYINFTNYQERRFYQEKNLVFCKTDLIPLLFNEVRNLNVSIILISHQSDYEVNDRQPNFDSHGNLMINWSLPSEGHTPALFLLKPPQIKKWFAQNVNLKHPDLIPIPIGLENHHGPSRGSSIDPEYLLKMPEITLDSLNEIKGKNVEKIYVNFGDTHNNRKYVRDFLVSNNLCDLESSRLGFGQYLEKASKYLFVASPRGNGIDTHRTWESLYMGSIPIVERHFMYDGYNLPIWQIDSWEELLDKSKFDYWIEKYHKGELFTDISRLFMTYWKQRILKEFQNL